MNSLRKRIIAPIIALSILSSCATNPSKMGAADVSPLKYEGYTCKQIGLESDRISHKVTQLYESLKSKAKADNAQMAVGLFLFWPALLLLEGGDGPEASEYRQLKGEYDALEKIAIQKECGIEFKNIEEELKKEAEENKESFKSRRRTKN